MPDQLPTLPHVYTEGDINPVLIVAFRFDISAFTEIAAIVERPDGTVFERIAAILNANQAQFTWQATDWLAGCSQLTVRLLDAGSLPSHVPPILVEVKDKPPAATP